MKKMTWGYLFALGLFAVAPVLGQTASSNPGPCATCKVTASEPGLLLQLGLGLPALGGLLILGRHRYLNRTHKSS